MAHTTNNIGLSDYLKKVDSGELRIPEFQRDFVWNKSQQIKLVASLLKGYPIGSFLLMQANDSQYASSSIEGVTANLNNNDVVLILDGQQRTTTAYQVFYSKGEFKFYFNYGQFIDDIKCDLNNVHSIIEEKIEDWIEAIENKNSINDDSFLQKSKGYFPLCLILNAFKGDDYTKWLNDYSYTKAYGDQNKFTEFSNYQSIFTTELINQIVSYQVSEITIDKNTNTNVVCTIFETLNSTGVKLTIFDLLNAKCYPKNFLLRSELEKAFNDNPIFLDYDQNKDDLIGLSLIKFIALLSKKSCKRADILNLDIDFLKDNWNKAIEKIKNALEYIRKNYGVYGNKFFPYKDVLPVIAYIIPNLSNNRNKIKLDIWYWNLVFSSYFDHATDTKSAKSIKELLGTNKEKGWFDDDNLIPDFIKSFNLEQINLEKLFNQSSQYKAILNIILLNEAKDFMLINNAHQKISDFKEIELNDHHIFPYRVLSGKGIDKKIINSILNRTLISISANQKIKDKEPNIYFNDIELIGKFDSQCLESHFISDDIKNNSLTNDLFNDFIMKRKEMLLKKIEKLIDFKLTPLSNQNIK